MDVNNNKVPKIRFPEFTEPWEQRKLGDICQVTMGQSPDGSTYSDEPSDYILVQGNADLKNGWVSPRVWTSQKTKTAQAGDLIMSVRAPAGAMGKTAYDIVIGRGVAAIKGNEFIYQTLVKLDSDGYWKKLAAGSTFESINSDAVKSALISIPQDVNEQNKIGSYFVNLDNLITLHQRECEHYKELKKAMLQKMFPEKNQLIPEIRFPEFTEPWEQRKLSDIVDFLDTKRKPIESGNRKPGIYPYYGASGIVDYIDDYIFDEELILLSEDGANILDRNYPVCFLATGKYWVNNHAHVLKSKEDYDNNFICISLEKKDYRKYNSGMAMPKLNQDVCKVLPVSCPSFAEQQQIGEYFRQMDNLITLHQGKYIFHYKLQISIKFIFVTTVFTQTWEQRKLSEMLERYENPIEIPRDGYHRLGLRSHGKGTFHSYVEKGKELETGKMNVVAANKFIVNITFGWEHAVAITSEEDAGKLVSHRFPQFTLSDYIEPSFLKYLILDKRFKNHLILSSPGGAGRNRVLKIDQMLEYEISIPSIAEQRKIGDVLMAVDQTITLHQRNYYEKLIIS